MDALFKECRKESIDYKIVAITSTAEVVDSFDIDRFSQMKDIVDRYIRKVGMDLSIEHHLFKI